MTTLFFDVETTGLARDKLPAIHPKQPMPAQLGWKLDAENGVERGAANLLIRTGGQWTISPGASKVTGIDDVVADAFGIDLITAVEAFLDILDAADTVVAHNMAFDSVVMRRAVFVYSEKIGVSYVDPFEGKTMVCTMLASMNIIKALPKRNGQWKWPKLSEAVRFFFNESIDGAHDALVDVKACARVFYRLREMGVFSDEYDGVPA